MNDQVGISESYDIHVLMSSIEEENLVARMILARDLQVFIGKLNVIFKGFIGIRRVILKFAKKLIRLLAKTVGAVSKTVTIISLARLW